jgi:hypothetical protein
VASAPTRSRPSFVRCRLRRNVLLACRFLRRTAASLPVAAPARSPATPPVTAPRRERFRLRACVRRSKRSASKTRLLPDWREAQSTRRHPAAARKGRRGPVGSGGGNADTTPREGEHNTRTHQPPTATGRGSLVSSPYGSVKSMSNMPAPSRRTTADRSPHCFLTSPIPLPWRGEPAAEVTARTMTARPAHLGGPGIGQEGPDKHSQMLIRHQLSANQVPGSSRSSGNSGSSIGGAPIRPASCTGGRTPARRRWGGGLKPALSCRCHYPNEPNYPALSEHSRRGA